MWRTLFHHIMATHRTSAPTGAEVVHVPTVAEVVPTPRADVVPIPTCAYVCLRVPTGADDVPIPTGTDVWTTPDRYMIDT